MLEFSILEDHYYLKFLRHNIKQKYDITEQVNKHIQLFILKLKQIKFSSLTDLFFIDLTLNGINSRDRKAE